MISQRILLMSLDPQRGLPRATVAPHVIATGLLFDLEAAHLINWSDDDLLTLNSSTRTSDPLLKWAADQLGFLGEGTASRFAMNAIVLKTWDQVGHSLVREGLVTCKRSWWRRNRYYLTRPDARRRVVEEARTLLFADTAAARNDPCLAVLSACSVGEEFLSLSPLSDFDVAQFFGSRPDDSPAEEKAWLCVKSTACRHGAVHPVTPGS